MRGPFPPPGWSCPQAWWAQPTGEQIAAWIAELQGGVVSMELPKVLDGEFPHGLVCAGCRRVIAVGEWYTSRLTAAADVEDLDALAGGAEAEGAVAVVELVCRACGMPEGDG